MAEPQGTVLIVDLGLQETETRVEGLGGVEELVAGYGVVGGFVAEEGGVVGAEVGDVVVVAGAEFGGVVACCGG